MRTNRSAGVGVVCAMLVGGALFSNANAADNPPLFKQRATIDAVNESSICGGIAGKPHVHKGLDDSHVVPGQKFKVNRRFLQDYLRFIDLDGVSSDEIQKPDMYTIHEQKNPLPIEGFSFLPACADTNRMKCISIDDFPLSFGIRLLENDDTSITPHAYVYLPLHSNAGTPPQKGDEFCMGVLHIPDNPRDCNYINDSLFRKHCRLTWNLKEVWAAPNFTQAKFKAAIESEYQKLLKELFDDFGLCGDLIVPLELTKDCKNLPPGNWLNIKTARTTDLLFTMFLHNDIIHGKLF